MLLIHFTWKSPLFWKIRIPSFKGEVMEIKKSKKLALKIVGIERAGKMTERQIAAKVRQYFLGDKQWWLAPTCLYVFSTKDIESRSTYITMGGFEDDPKADCGACNRSLVRSFYRPECPGSRSAISLLECAGIQGNSFADNFCAWAHRRMVVRAGTQERGSRKEYPFCRLITGYDAASLDWNGPPWPLFTI